MVKLTIYIPDILQSDEKHTWRELVVSAERPAGAARAHPRGYWGTQHISDYSSSPIKLLRGIFFPVLAMQLVHHKTIEGREESYATNFAAKWAICMHLRRLLNLE